LGLVPELACYLLAISRAPGLLANFSVPFIGTYSACPLLAGSGFLRMGPLFVSVCVIPSDLGSSLDIGRSFELHERTITIFPRFELFSLVQFC
jgi:hypothetical protein